MVISRGKLFERQNVTPAYMHIQNCRNVPVFQEKHSKNYNLSNYI